MEDPWDNNFVGALCVRYVRDIVKKHVNNVHCIYL